MLKNLIYKINMYIFIVTKNNKTAAPRCKKKKKKKITESLHKIGMSATR